MALQVENILILIFSILIGGIAGEGLRLHDRLLRLGGWVQRTVRIGSERFTEG